jgi:hypothetical protein
MLHTFPKYFLKSFSCLGDPWKGRWFGSCGFRLGLLFRCLVDCPRAAGGPSAGCSSSRCSLCSSLVLERSLFDSFGQFFLARRSSTGHPPGGRGPSARHKLLSDSPRVGYRPSVFRGAFLVVLFHLTDCLLEGRGPSSWFLRTVRPSLADRPPYTTHVC